MAPDQANHAVRDGDYPIVYIAGDLGGLYKYFPDSGEIYLMQPIDSDAGERGLMVGYAALTRVPPVAGILELVVMPTAASSLDKVAHFVPGDGWILKNPPATHRPWSDVTISSRQPDNWVAYTKETRSWGSQDLFASGTNGNSWVRVDLEESGSNVIVYFAQWSPHADNFLWVAGRTAGGGVEGSADVWYGNPFSGELNRINVISPPRRHTGFYGIAVMENGTLLLRGRTGGSLDQTWPVYNVAPDGTVTSLGGVSVNQQAGHQVIGLIGTNNTLALYGADHSLFKATHYNERDMVDTGTNVHTPADSFNVPAEGSRGYIDVIQGMRYFVARPNTATAGIFELTNPFGSPSLLPSYGQGYPVGSVRADQQSRTALAAMSKRTGQGVGQALFYVFTEGAWSEMNGPAEASPADLSAFALEPIVRPG